MPTPMPALMQELAVRVRQIVRHRRAFLEHADVEDLVQDVLLSVHAVRATYDATPPFHPVAAGDYAQSTRGRRAPICAAWRA